MKKINDVASAVAKREGKKSETKMGDVKEVLAIISDLIFADPNVAILLYQNGKKRAAKKKK